MDRIDLETKTRTRFGILPTIEGYDVIALDTGRPIAHREDAQSANGVAYRLNDAANAGPKVLANAIARMVR